MPISMFFALILITIAVFIFGASFVTTFILWEPQWFFSSATGWRTAVVIALIGGASQ